MTKDLSSRYLQLFKKPTNYAVRKLHNSLRIIFKTLPSCRHTVLRSNNKAF
ncbi:hypothetical protein V1477_001225 [Vespula maculifrons]|uniref:Uncharacterized protein n=1 Tax=Vespula maculifrons TaxID=7453 RepID=A0ABD2CZ97_VESMC